MRCTFVRTHIRVCVCTQAYMHLRMFMNICVHVYMKARGQLLVFLRCCSLCSLRHGLSLTWHWSRWLAWHRSPIDPSDAPSLVLGLQTPLPPSFYYMVLGELNSSIHAGKANTILTELSIVLASVLFSLPPNR